MSSVPRPRVLISRESIEVTVKRLAFEISRDYRSRPLVLVGILKGSFVFLADLMRSIDLPLKMDFVRVSSYGTGTESSGGAKVSQKLLSSVEGEHVLLVEDIVDTGLTTSFVLKYLKRKKPASLKLCALTDKPSRRQVPVNIDYLGFKVPDKFLIGYGLDFGEKYRNLPDICVLEKS